MFEIFKPFRQQLNLTSPKKRFFNLRKFELFYNETSLKESRGPWFALAVY